MCSQHFIRYYTVRYVKKLVSPWRILLRSRRRAFSFPVYQISVHGPIPGTKGRSDIPYANEGDINSSILKHTFASRQALVVSLPFCPVYNKSRVADDGQ